MSHSTILSVVEKSLEEMSDPMVGSEDNPLVAPIEVGPFVSPSDGSDDDAATVESLNIMPNNGGVSDVV